MKGVDVSAHNTNVNFSALRRGGVDFAILRAGLGQKLDSRFRRHLKGAKAAGMLIGAYWFAYPLTAREAQLEADKCAAVLSDVELDLPVFYDFEYDTERYATEKGARFGIDQRTSLITAFCERLKSHGYTVGIYTNPDYWLYKLDSAKLSRYPLWIAAYRRSDCKATFEDTSPGNIPPAFAKAMIWQPGKCRMNGSGWGEIDIDYGYGLPAAKTQQTKSGYKPGDLYKIKAGDKYSNGHAVPARLVGTTYTVKQVKKDAILLKEILSWVRV